MPLSQATGSRHARKGRHTFETASHTSAGRQPSVQGTLRQLPWRHAWPLEQRKPAQPSFALTQSPPGAHASPVGQSASTRQVQWLSTQLMPGVFAQARPHWPQLSGLEANGPPSIGRHS